MITAALIAFLGFTEIVSAQTEENEGKKVLVVYYSRSGNTRTMAQQIQKATGADLFEIEMKEAYPSDYQQLVDLAKKEISEGVKPALKSMPKELAKYDVIFVGSPCWWSTIAPPVASFLSTADLTGKTVVPFVTHGGSGMAKCETDAAKLCPKAKLLKGLAVSGSAVKRSASQVEKWLKEIGVIK